MTKQCTRVAIPANSRKGALEAAAELLVDKEADLSSRTIFDALMARERLGSTGLGEGVAIPHCGLPCDSVRGAFLKLNQGVDYDAPDSHAVDLLFVLIVPPEETSAHLEVLASLARIFGEADNRDALRACGTDGQLHETLVGLYSSESA